MVGRKLVPCNIFSLEALRSQFKGLGYRMIH